MAELTAKEGSWLAFLEAAGANLEGRGVGDFGDPAGELRAAAEGTVIADLSHRGLIAFAGEDTAAFLQGQLTCDVREVRPAAASLGGYCTPKGRLLATFVLFRHGDRTLMELCGDLREAVQKRLSMYILRSKVKAADAGPSFVRLGLSGPGAEALVSRALGAAPPDWAGPARPLPAMEAGDAAAVRLGPSRFELFAPAEAGQALWTALAADAKPVGADAWAWLDIRAGIPWITAPTQDQFVPQMVNLEAVGGVSFQKGCYPGQEIVARSQYLGQVKRRLFRAHLDVAERPVAGDALFAADSGEQAAGMIVNAAPAPGGGFDLLAVLQTASAEAGAIVWRRADGPVLRIETRA